MGFDISDGVLNKYDAENENMVVIPDGVIKIGDSAFSGCKNIETVIIPNTVKTIGERAFENCTSLNEIVIPESINIIGAFAFYYCKALQKINMPKRLTELAYGLFLSSGIKSIDIPSSVKIIDGSVFRFSKLESIIIPNGVTDIKSYAFNPCNIKEVVIPSSVKGRIFRDTFSCESIRYKVNFPSDGIIDFGNDTTVLENYTLAIDKLHDITCDDDYMLLVNDKTVLKKHIRLVAAQRLLSDGESLSKEHKGFYERIAIDNRKNLIWDYAKVQDQTMLSKLVDKGYAGVKEVQDVINNNKNDNDNQYRIDFLVDFANNAFSVDEIAHDNLRLQKNQLNDLWAYKKNEGEISIYGYKGYKKHATEVEIPSCINGIPVKRLTFVDRSRYDFEHIKNLIIPYGVTSIDDNVFTYEQGIHTVSIPDSVKHIAKRAFSYTGHITIICSEGSIAHEYAIKLLLKFVLTRKKGQ